MNAVATMSEEAMVDRATCKKAGSLSAYGLGDRQIADALLLNEGQVAWAKSTQEFRDSFAVAAQSRAERAIELEEGWDALESRALATVLETIEHNRDPKFALHAAFVANKAARKSPSSAGRVIDAAHSGNVIMLQINQKFVTKIQTGETQATLDITPAGDRLVPLPKKSHDVPTPKKVGALLGIVDKAAQRNDVDELIEQCKQAGITIELLE